MGGHLSIRVGRATSSRCVESPEGLTVVEEPRQQATF